MLINKTQRASNSSPFSLFNIISMISTRYQHTGLDILLSLILKMSMQAKLTGFRRISFFSDITSSLSVADIRNAWKIFGRYLTVTIQNNFIINLRSFPLPHIPLRDHFLSHISNG